MPERAHETSSSKGASTSRVSPMILYKQRVFLEMQNIFVSRKPNKTSRQTTRVVRYLFAS